MFHGLVLVWDVHSKTVLFRVMNVHYPLHDNDIQNFVSVRIRYTKYEY